VDNKPLSISINLNNTFPIVHNKKQLNKIYTLNFEMDTEKTKKSKIYIPRFNINTFDEADYFANIFEMDKPFTENEEYFKFLNSSGELTVFKFINLVTFENNILNYFSEEKVTSEKEAASIAENFMLNNFMYIKFNKVEVEESNDIYNVKFLNTLDNLSNHSFNSNVLVDRHGNILRMDYFYVDFDKLNNITLKSMDKAYLELPIDFNNKIEIVLNSCNLVYIFENSIVQPAYHFLGKNSNDERFDCYVKASIFN
jgi:hypothetical protein